MKNQTTFISKITLSIKVNLPTLTDVDIMFEDGASKLNES